MSPEPANQDHASGYSYTSGLHAYNFPHASYLALQGLLEEGTRANTGNSDCFLDKFEMVANPFMPPCASSLVLHI